MEIRVVFVSQAPIPEELVAQVPGSGARKDLEGGYGHAVSIMCDHADPTGLRNRLRKASGDVSVAVITGPLATQPAKLVLCDVDSTFTSTEGVDMLAEYVGREEEVAAITQQAMHGHLEFAESLRMRVAAIKGVPTSAFEAVGERMALSPGAEELVAAARAAGAKVGLTSGGFTQLVAPLAERNGLDYFSANQLGTEILDGVEVLNGQVVGKVVDRAQKERDLEEFADTFGVELPLAVTIGDGANDLDMLAAAGLGVAYCAKPATEEGADVSLRFARLDAVIPLAFDR